VAREDSQVVVEVFIGFHWNSCWRRACFLLLTEAVLMSAVVQTREPMCSSFLDVERASLIRLVPYCCLCFAPYIVLRVSEMFDGKGATVVCECTTCMFVDCKHFIFGTMLRSTVQI
jgi:hypothetical protein